MKILLQVAFRPPILSAPGRRICCFTVRSAPAKLQTAISWSRTGYNIVVVMLPTRSEVYFESSVRRSFHTGGRTEKVMLIAQYSVLRFHRFNLLEANRAADIGRGEGTETRGGSSLSTAKHRRHFIDSNSHDGAPLVVSRTAAHYGD